MIIIKLNFFGGITLDLDEEHMETTKGMIKGRGKQIIPQAAVVAKCK